MKKKSPWGHQGQAILEYILLTSFIGIVCLVALQNYGEILESRINKLKAKIASRIQIDNE